MPSKTPSIAAAVAVFHSTIQQIAAAKKPRRCDHRIPEYGCLHCEVVRDEMQNVLRTSDDPRRRLAAAEWLLRFAASDLSGSVSRREIRRSARMLTRAAKVYTRETSSRRTRRVRP